MPSYRQLLRQVQADLAPHEARSLVESLPSLACLSDVALATSDPEVSPGDLELFAEWRQRAAEGEPIQLITGWAPFCELAAPGAAPSKNGRGSRNWNRSDRGRIGL